MVPRIKLGELLVRAGVLDETRLKAALTEQQRWGGRLGKILVEMNFLSEDMLVKALSKQLGLPPANLDQLDVPKNVLERLDAEFAQFTATCPTGFDVKRGVLRVAMADPLNVNAVDEMRSKTGLKIEPVIAGESAIMAAIGRLYGIEPETYDNPSDWIVSTGGGAFTPGPSSRRSEVPEAPAATVPGAPLAPGPGGKTPAPYAQYLPPLQIPSTPAPAPAAAVEMASALGAAQQKQLKAIRAMVDILVDKGVFTRDEYLDRVKRK